MLNSRPISPFIVAVPGPELDARTKEAIDKLRPAGFILFGWNCKEHAQLEKLVTELKELSPFATPLILIDEEGGRVRRIKWTPYQAPAAEKIGNLYNKDPKIAVRAAMLNGFLTAAQLLSYGITCTCAPVADVKFPETDDVIGNRSFGSDPEKVGHLCGATISGLLAGGVWPVIKHAPGHGRATADSHKELPVVTALADQLFKVDFKPFEMNAAVPFVMTAHVKYTALDAENCATQSAKIIQIMKEDIGLEGLIVSDDLTMGALEGDIISRAEKSLNAGCDLLLYCRGDLFLKELTEEALESYYNDLSALSGKFELSGKAHAKIQKLPALVPPNPDVLKDSYRELLQIYAENGVA